MLDTDHSFQVDVIGFNETERRILSSVFGLAARRDPSFHQRDSASKEPADMYLVDADDEGAMREFRLVHNRFAAPSVLVGSSDRGTGLLLLARPLQWVRLLQAFEELMLGEPGQTESRSEPNVDAGAGDSEKTLVLRRTTPPRTMPPRTPSPAPQAQRPGLNVSAGAGDCEKTLVLRRTTTSAPGIIPPRASPPAPQGQRPEAAPLRPAPAVREKQISDWVLVVDDSAMVRKFMARKLAPYGFGVDFAETGEEAIGMTGEKEYTCVFLDVVLPGIDGYQVCKLIKSNKQAIQRTAIVMLTSRTSAFDKLRGSLAGCDEYLTKPMDENRLLEVIAKFLPVATREAV